MTHTSSPPTASRAMSSAAGSDDATTAPSSDHPGCRVTTTLVRPGSGRTLAGSDSQVSLPMTTGCPAVVRLKCAKSSGTCHGMAPPAPMTGRPAASRACAQISPTTPRPPRDPSDRDPSAPGPSDSNRCLDAGMVLVADHLDVLVGVVEDRRTGREPQPRVRVGVARELRGHLLHVVVVDVAVAAGPYEVADREPGLCRHHVRQQRVRGDVEGHAEEQVGRALVELAAQPAVR